MQVRATPLYPLRLVWIPIGLLAMVACAWLALSGVWPVSKARYISHPTGILVARKTVAPPLPVAVDTAVMPVSVIEAKAINARISVSTAPIEVARPFVLRPLEKDWSGSVSHDFIDSRDMALDCLTAAVYYEAASESAQGQRAVAQVVLNRMRHPAFPKSICGVVYQGSERTTGCQFSFTCDGSLARHPSPTGWQRARGIAFAALAGVVEPTVGTATHYHTDWVVPYWASSLDKVSVIGAHIFYRWKGYWGHRAAFSGTYVGESKAVIPVTIAYDALADPGTETPAVDARIRPLADQIGRILPTHEAGAATAPRLRADESHATLAADQQLSSLDEAGLKGRSD